MNLVAPERLLLLGIVVVLAGLYAWLTQQRRHRAVRFSNFGALRAAVPPRPGWQRHAPAALVALALGALIFGIAGPTRQVRVPKEAATVMLVLDMSASMRATDVEPSRVDAAISAAKSFVEDLPHQVRVGLLSFDRTPHLVNSPTLDHRAVLEGLGELTLGPGTAGGDALYAALDAVEASYGDRPDSAKADGAAIVLLSDGVTTVGSSVHAAAEQAADEGIPVSTIAFGTNAGSVFVEGRRVAVPADPDTMREVAETTGGKAFEAASGDELRSVYEDIGTRVSYESQRRDASGRYLTMGALALAAGFGLALAWPGRLI